MDSRDEEEDHLEAEDVNMNEVQPLSYTSGSSTSTSHSMVDDPSLVSPILASLHFSKPPASLDDNDIIETITNQQIQLLFSFQEFHQLLKESNECYYLQQQQKQQQQRSDISNPVEPSTIFSTSSSSSSTEADTTPLSHELVGYWGERFVYYYLQKVLPLSSTSTSTSDRQKVKDDGGYCYQDYVIEWNNEKEESLSFYDILIKERQLIVPSTVAQQQQLQLQQQQKRGKKQQRSTTSLSWKEKEKSYFIEIKSTQYDLKKNVFNISWNEFQFAFYHHLPSSSASATTTASSTSNTQVLPSHYRKVPYYVFRVFNVFNYFKTEIIILKDIQKLLEKGRIKLCFAV
jgi:hypothetical protein